MKINQVTASFYGATDTGMVRTNNEDSFIATEIWNGTHLLLAAIDGIGGYEGGEVAAGIATEVITGMVSKGSPHDCLKLLKAAVTEANNEIVRQKKADATRGRMGCVISSAIIDIIGQRLYMVHVGDSRLYAYTCSEGLRKLSHDHSLVGYREEVGLLTEEQAMKHPQRNIIDRSLGDEWHSVEDPDFLDSGIFPILESTQFLFCSDGLSDMLYSAEITSVLEQELTPKEEATKLIQMANEAGGKDNVTAVIAKVNVPSETTSSTSETVHFAETNDTTDIPAARHTEPDNKPKDFRKAYLYIISLAIAFLLGGSTGYFIGLYTARTEAAQIAAQPIAPADSIVAQPNMPADSIADPHQVGKQTADSLNSMYKEKADSSNTRVR